MVLHAKIVAVVIQDENTKMIAKLAILENQVALGKAGLLRFATDCQDQTDKVALEENTTIFNPRDKSSFQPINKAEGISRTKYAA